MLPKSWLPVIRELNLRGPPKLLALSNLLIAKKSCSMSYNNVWHVLAFLILRIFKFTCINSQQKKLFDAHALKSSVDQKLPSHNAMTRYERAHYFKWHCNPIILLRETVEPWRIWTWLLCSARSFLPACFIFGLPRKAPHLSLFSITKVRKSNHIRKTSLVGAIRT